MLFMLGYLMFTLDNDSFPTNRLVLAFNVRYSKMPTEVQIESPVFIPNLLDSSFFFPGATRGAQDRRPTLVRRFLLMIMRTQCGVRKCDGDKRDS
jgi:hypothetical protein